MDNGDNRQAEQLGKLEVAFVVPRHGHDGPGAVGGQHVVRDPNGDLLAIHRVDGIRPGEHAGLGLGQLGAVEVALACRSFLIVLHRLLLFRRGDAGHQRMLWGQHHVGGTEERVGPSRIHRDATSFNVFATLSDASNHLRRKTEKDFSAFTASNPIPLHLLDAVAPVERFQVVDQPLGIRGDAHEPLLQRSADHGVLAAFALAVDHFLIRQHRAQRLAPVHRHFGEVGQAAGVDVLAFRFAERLRYSRNRQFADRPAALQLRVVPGVVKLQEDPLRPLEVGRVGGIHFPVPVVAEAQALDLPAEVVDVVSGIDARVFTGLDGVLLGGQAEGIPAHRVQHVEAAHPLVTRQDVGGGVAFGVAHMQTAPAGVWEHVEDVVLRLAATVVRRAEGLVLFPIVLPLGFDVGGLVTRHGGGSNRLECF